jgi:glycerophosphoryl diester phosphodiesterase
MAAWRTLDGRPTRIIAHRGASGRFPEHSGPAFEQAVADGADVLEPDLVPSSDRVLFARHDAWLSRSTDVASRPQFASRRERGLDDREDWWSDRFSSAELRSLCAVQVKPRREQSHNGLHPLLDVEQVLDIAGAAGLTAYPELKHPQWFAQRGVDVVGLLAEVLVRRGLCGREAPLWVQCFEPEPLWRVHQALGVKVFPLVRYDSAAPRALLERVLDETRAFASGVAVNKRLLRMADSAAWIGGAHAQGLEVHAWTFRDDDLPPEFATAQEELSQAFELGIDAVFCDFPDSGVQARMAFEQLEHERRRAVAPDSQ